MAERHYFFIPPRDGVPASVTLDGDEFHHCVRVCRVRVGERVKLLDGRGGVFDARVERIGAREALLSVIGVERTPPQTPVDIAVGMLKAPRLDFVLEKCTEIGCRSIILFHSAASIARPGRTGALRLDRIRRKVLAACKQSGQPYLPEVAILARFDELLERCRAYKRVVVADSESGTAPGEAAGGLNAVLGIVGPEGGLSAGERAALAERGAAAVSLGPHRLRSETAAVCLLFLLSSAMREEGARG